MKNNLQDHLNWLQNEYCFEMDPVIVKAKDALRNGFPPTVDCHREAIKAPISNHYSANIYSTKAQGLDAECRDQIYKETEMAQGTGEEDNFNYCHSIDKPEGAPVTDDHGLGLSEGFFEGDNIGDFLEPEFGNEISAFEMPEGDDLNMDITEEPGVAFEEDDKAFAEFNDFEPDSFRRSNTAFENSCTPPAEVDPLEIRHQLVGGRDSSSSDPTEEMKQLLQEKTNVSMEICDLMERFDTASGIEMHDLSQKLAELRQKRKDLDSRLVSLKDLTGAALTRPTVVSVPHHVAVPEEKSNNSQIVFDNKSSEWDHKNFPWTRNIKKAMKKYASMSMNPS